MNTEITNFVQAIAALGSLILLSSALVLLIVEYLKELAGLNQSWADMTPGQAKKQRRKIHLLALAVGIAWGAVALRLPALLIWPEMNGYLGGAIVGALSGMAAIGGKSTLNSGIDRSAEARASATASAAPEAAADWAAAWGMAMSNLPQTAAASPEPGPELTAPATDLPGAAGLPDPTVSSADGAEPVDDLTAVTVRPMPLLGSPEGGQISRTPVPFD